MGILAELNRAHLERRQRFDADYIPAFLPKREAPKPLRIKIPPAWPNWGWHKIVSECCEKHGVAVKEVMQHCRLDRVVRCRWEIMHRMRHEVLVGGKQISTLQIGSRLGIDHATVLYGLKRHAGATVAGARARKASMVKEELTAALEDAA